MTIDDYLALPYTLTLKPDSDDKGHSGYVAQVPELPGVGAQGATEAEALENLHDAMAAWLDVALRKGAEIPLPKEDSRYSGRVLLRLPVSLHAELARAAEAEGVSLNQFMVGALAGAVHWLVPTARDEQPVSDERTAGEGGIVILGEKSEPVFSFVDVDALPLAATVKVRLKAEGVNTVGDLLNKSLDDYGERLAASE